MRGSYGHIDYSHHELEDPDDWRWTEGQHEITLVGDSSGPKDLTVTVRAEHDSSVSIAIEVLDVPRTFLTEDIQAAIINAVSMSCMEVVVWTD